MDPLQAAVNEIRLNQNDPVPICRLSDHRHDCQIVFDLFMQQLERQLTTVPGLYAAGDVVHGLAQISVAMGHAAIAATAIHNGLPLPCAKG